MKNIINYLIRKIKKTDYTVDSKIPNSYLLGLSFRRVIMLFRGLISFVKNKGSFFIGSGVKVRARSLIRLGKGVTFCDNCYVDAVSSEGIIMGDNVSVGNRTVIECTGNLQFLGKGLVVGNNVGLGTDSFYGCNGGIYIGDNTVIGNYVSFHAENHNFSRLDIPIRDQGVNHKGIIIHKNCWIGAKVTILDGSVIEEGCIIAAGAVVTCGLYQKNGIYGGVPAKLLKYRTHLNINPLINLQQLQTAAG
ncbi:MAG TPA: acyltransferase [Flavitalea sp.]|nr:acyltransferase [Flavitalea sp.]